MSQASTMDEVERTHHYVAQAPGRPLTPRQVRRLNKKAKRVAVSAYLSQT